MPGTVLGAGVVAENQPDMVSALNELRFGSVGKTTNKLKNIKQCDRLE